MRRIGLSLLAILLLAVAVTPVWAHGVRRPTPPIEPAERPVEIVVGSPILARAPNGAVRFERNPRRPPVGPQSPGPAEVAGVLIVALGLAGLGRSWRRDRRMAVATVTAALALGFVVEITPHLVHHVLDPDKGAGCEVLQTAERSQAAVGAVDATPDLAPTLLIDPPSVVPVPDATSRLPRAGAPLRPRPDPPSTHLRAPTARGRAAVPTLPRSRLPRGSGS